MRQRATDEQSWFNRPENYALALKELADAKQRVLEEFTTEFDIEVEGKVQKAGDVIRAFVGREAKARSAGRGAPLSKFEGKVLIPGRPELAALGINKQLGVDDQVIWSGMGAGLAAMRHEIMLSGTEVDKECFEYVVDGKAGDNGKEWPHSGHKKMDQFYEAKDGKEIDVTDARVHERVGKGLEFGGPKEP